jgi:bacterioferritin (cytochrome b1)
MPGWARGLDCHTIHGAVAAARQQELKMSSEHADNEPVALKALLRCQMTAVHQQFMHILALREAGDLATAARIQEVDYVDFPTAMKVLALLIARDEAPGLPPENIAPGRTRAEMLAAEAAMESRMAVCLAQAAAVCDETALQMIATATAPREDYAAWLKAESAADTAIRVGAAGYMDQLVAALTAIVEQEMIEAFARRHDDDDAGAQSAWTASVTAMTQIADLVRAVAPAGRMPAVAATSLEPAWDRASRARRAAAAARRAAADGPVEEGAFKGSPQHMR